MKSFVLLALMSVAPLVGCSSTPPRETNEQMLAEMKRVIAENYLLGMEVKCLKEPLTAAQKDYLIATKSAYVSQRYVSALITDPSCEGRAVRSCEKIYPGQCVAVQGELAGKVP